MSKDCAISAETARLFPWSERQRFFVITAGRTGSTLLASILADAGANFGMPPATEWQVSRGGDMELPDARRAANRFRIAFERSPRKPVSVAAKHIWMHHVSAGKRHLAHALKQACFLKAVNLDLAVPHAIKLGYFPKVIVSYRPFAEYAVSSSQMLGSRPVSVLQEDYERIYSNALLQLFSFGGCAVSYDDLVAPDRLDWARSLAEVTGLSAEALLASRARRLSSRDEPVFGLPKLSEPATRIQAAIEQCKGRALPPSAPALRNWMQRMGAEAERSTAPSPRWRGFRRTAAEAMAFCAAIVDRRVPWYARAAAIGLIAGYLAAPWDPIPDNLPYVGHADDAVATAFAMFAFMRLVPAEVVRKLRLEAAQRLGTPPDALAPLNRASSK